MANIGWSRDAIASLCDMFRDNRCLWDSTDPDYMKKTLKRQVYKNLAESLKREFPREMVEINEGRFHLLLFAF